MRVSSFRAALLIVLVSTVFPAVAADRGYLCRKELEKGYQPQNYVWKDFQYLSITSGYVVRRLEGGDIPNYIKGAVVTPSDWGVFYMTGEKASVPQLFCTLSQGTVACGDDAYNFVMNTKTLRYVSYDFRSYLGDDRSDFGSVYIEMGTCEAIP